MVSACWEQAWVPYPKFGFMDCWALPLSVFFDYWISETCFGGFALHLLINYSKHPETKFQRSNNSKTPKQHKSKLRNSGPRDLWSRRLNYDNLIENTTTYSSKGPHKNAPRNPHNPLAPTWYSLGTKLLTTWYQLATTLVPSCPKFVKHASELTAFCKQAGVKMVSACWEQAWVLYPKFRFVDYWALPLSGFLFVGSPKFVWWVLHFLNYSKHLKTQLQSSSNSQSQIPNNTNPNSGTVAGGLRSNYVNLNNNTTNYYRKSPRKNAPRKPHTFWQQNWYTLLSSC